MAATQHPLSGRVTIGPICAGPQREGVSCAGPLSAAEVQLLDAAGAVVARASTDAAGRFTIRAAAGHYRLHLALPTKVVRCPNIDISLPRADAAPLVIDCDSGMR